MRAILPAYRLIPWRRSLTAPLCAAAFAPLWLGALAGCLLRGPVSSSGGSDWEISEATARRFEAADDALFQGPDEVLVRVNGRPLTRRELIARAVRQLGAMTMLSAVVKEELFLQEAERRGIEVTDEEVDRQVEDIIESMSRDLGEDDAVKGREALADLYAREGLSLDNVRRDQRRRSRNQLLIAKVTKSLRRADDATLRQFYRTHRRYWARHIAYRFPLPSDAPTSEARALKETAREKALRAIELLRGGKAQFEALAMAESDDEVTRAFGGNLGPVTEDAPMPPELKKAIFSLGAGEVSEPVENPRGGYHVFQVTRIEPSEPYEAVVDKLREEFLEREPDLAEVREAFYALREKARVTWTAGTALSQAREGVGPEGAR